MIHWQYTLPAATAEAMGIPRCVMRTLDDGSQESCLASREDIVAWVADGNVIEDA